MGEGEKGRKGNKKTRKRKSVLPSLCTSLTLCCSSEAGQHIQAQWWCPVAASSGGSGPSLACSSSQLSSPPLPLGAASCASPGSSAPSLCLTWFLSSFTPSVQGVDQAGLASL